MAIVDKIEKLILKAIKELKYIAVVDKTICQDIYDHWRRDLRKLSDNHDNEGVSTPKIIGYFSFWLRKLQPISSAQPWIGMDNESNPIISEKHTNAHINELVAIYAIKLILIGLFTQKIKSSDDSSIRKKYQDQINRTKEAFDKLFSTLDRKSIHQSFIHVFLYDMRYRTFGPHHLTHVVRYIIERAEVDQNISFEGTNILGIRIKNSISHMRIFLSAPVDIQKKVPTIESYIHKNQKRWIKTHGVFVTLLTMQDLISELDKSKLAQVSILNQIKGNFDVYLGLIDKKFGTAIDGLAVGSGTEAEYNFAISSNEKEQNLDGKFIMFGRNSDAMNVKYSSLSKDEKEEFSKIDTFFKKISSDGQLYFEWNNKTFEQKLMQQIEGKVEQFKNHNF